MMSYFKQFTLYYLTIIFTILFFGYLEIFCTPKLSRTFQINSSIEKLYIEKEFITGEQCILLVCLLSMLVILAYCISGQNLKTVKYKFHKPTWLSWRYHLYHVSMVNLWMVLGINSALTNILKLYISNFRPDFIDRCNPIENLKPDVLYDITICQQENLKILYEGLKSTPSGHSSFAMAGLGYLYYWQLSHVHVNSIYHIWCIGLIILIMISRVLDHRHHWYDVLSGGLLGFVVIVLVTLNTNHTRSNTRNSILPM